MRTAIAFLAAILAPLAVARTPEETVSAYFEAMKSSDDAAVARLIHPDELREFKETYEPLIQTALRSAENRVGFSGFVDPYDPKKLRAMSDEQFMAAFVRWGEQWQSSSISYIKQAEFRVVGQVPDNDLNLVVVHVRLPGKELEIEPRVVMVTKDFEGEPRMLVPGDIKKWAAVLLRFRR